MYVGTYLSWLRPTSDARCYTSHDVEKENLFKGRDTLPLSIYHEDDMSKKTLFGGIFAHLAVAAIGWFWREKSVLTSQPCFPPSSKRRKSEGTISVRTFSNYIFLFPFCFIIPNVRSSSYFWRRRRYEVLFHTKQLDVWKLDGGGGSSLVCSTFFKSNGIAKFMTLQLTKLVATTATEGRNCQNHFKYRQRGNVGEDG